MLAALAHSSRRAAAAGNTSMSVADKGSARRRVPPRLFPASPAMAGVVTSRHEDTIQRFQAIHHSERSLTMVSNRPAACVRRSRRDKSARDH
jgi:hypothetical protein